MKEQGKNPKNWVWGMFYYNKDDDRIFVPKPNPADGSTLNFANRKSILVILAAICFFGFTIFMIYNKH